MKKNNSTYIDIWPMVNTLEPKLFLTLLSIEKVRVCCKISGRKWFPLMHEMIELKFASTLREAYNFIKWLYGDKWNEVEFNYYNAIRNSKSWEQAYNAFDKYHGIICEFDCAFVDFINVDAKNINIIYRKSKNDKLSAKKD